MADEQKKNYHKKEDAEKLLCPFLKENSQEKNTCAADLCALWKWIEAVPDSGKCGLIQN